jgi:U4/U6.U5 tri-snRNP-associated protein 1
MTPKEAFRDLSHKFHGKGPGKMKLEKRQKKYQDDLKTKQMKSSDTPLMSAEKMREAQARGQTPYLVLSGNAKSGYVHHILTTCIVSCMFVSRVDAMLS